VECSMEEMLSKEMDFCHVVHPAGRPAGSATEVTASSPSTLPVARVRADA
jgi:hypothetical protein